MDREAGRDWARAGAGTRFPRRQRNRAVGPARVDAVDSSVRTGRKLCRFGFTAAVRVAGASCIPPAGWSASGQRSGSPGRFPTAARAESDGRVRSRTQPRQPARRTRSRYRRPGALVTGSYGRGRVPHLWLFRRRPLTRGASRALSGGPCLPSRADRFSWVGLLIGKSDRRRSHGERATPQAAERSGYEGQLGIRLPAGAARLGCASSGFRHQLDRARRSAMGRSSS